MSESGRAVSVTVDRVTNHTITVALARTAMVVGIPLLSLLMWHVSDTADKITATLGQHTTDLQLLKAQGNWQGEALKDHEGRIRVIEANTRVLR